MDDKFILMGLGDENSKDIAEVLGNKTCQKILDFLSERKEASEKDISDGLSMPINTVEYNLKKLIKAGLVVKASNFFWSVKGKKIPMYKLAKKHIIISPNKKPTLDALKAILPVLGVFIAVVLIAVLLNNQSSNFSDKNADVLQKFSSYSEIKNFLEENSGSYEYSGRGGVSKSESFATGAAPSAASQDSASANGAESSAGAGDYSQTNVQVEGVDEPDIVKNDGKYIYIVQGKKVLIVEAFPAEGLKILDEIEFDDYVRNIFLKDDKLVVFLEKYEYLDSGVVCPDFGYGFEIGIRCGGYSKTTTNVFVYDISDRENAELKDEFELDGNYVDARLVDDYVYLISSKYISLNNFDLPVHSYNGAEKKVAAESVYYFNSYDENYVFNSVSAINVESGEIDTETYLMGSSNSIYVSESNIYLTYQKRLSQSYIFENYVSEVLIPNVPSDVANDLKEIMDSDDSFRDKNEKVSGVFEDYWRSLEEENLLEFTQKFEKASEGFYTKLQSETEKTVIHRINFDKDKIDYDGKGEVPGRVLNQFSMDEFEGNFRIATTTGGWNRDKNENNLYVLNSDLETIGKVENLAEGEQIYSARFIGDKAYLVTFRQTDPLFVIDLSSPENPKVLGELKITGYSGYLHPYDETHLIGIGMEATESGRTTGVKVSLFDVSDFANPKEIDSYEVTEGEWSNSEAVYDHKAVLFDKEKNLLVIPVSYNKKITSSAIYPQYDYWSGAFVFNVDLQGIDLKGKISHQEKEGSEYYYGGGYVKRALFMDDVLYTVSDTKVKANKLNDLTEIKEIELPVEYGGPIYYASDGVASGGAAEPAMVK